MATKPVLRVSDSLCHDYPSPCIDTAVMQPTSAGNTTVKANGKFICVNNDFLVSHKTGVHSGPPPPKIVAACKNVFVHSKLVAIVSNVSTCGATAVTGSSNVNVGNA